MADVNVFKNYNKSYDPAHILITCKDGWDNESEWTLLDQPIDDDWHPSDINDKVNELINRLNDNKTIIDYENNELENIIEINVCWEQYQEKHTFFTWKK
jgi:hypothetical protein